MKVNIVFSMKAKPHILNAFPKESLFKQYDLYSHKYSYICNYKRAIP